MMTLASTWPLYVALLMLATGALAWLAGAVALVLIPVRGIVRLVIRRRDASAVDDETPEDEWAAIVYEACHTTHCAHLSTPHHLNADGSLLCLRCEHVAPAA